MIKINYTAYLVNNFKSILDYHLPRIRKKIIEKHDCVFNIFAFPYDSSIFEILKNNDVDANVFWSEENEYEFPALIDLAMKPCDKNLYLHTKGVSKNGCNINVDTWNRYMTHFNVELSDICIDKLDDCDCVGVEFHKSPFPHYSGNFWWCSKSHALKLSRSEFIKDTGMRLNAEKLVGSVNGKFLSLCESNLNLYENLFDESMWKRNDVIFDIRGTHG